MSEEEKKMVEYKKLEPEAETFNPETHAQLPDGSTVKMNRKMRRARQSIARKAARRGKTVRAVVALGKTDVVVKVPGRSK